MNKPSKFALALAFAAVTASGAASAQTVDNWRNPFGDVWKNGTNELCWRDAFWTPATGIPGCDGVPVAQKEKSAPMAAKVVFNADTFFDFDKSTLKPEGRQLLDQVAQQAGTIDLETIIAVGHTDSIGTEAYNQKLSERRAAAVKTYLVSKGIDPNRIYTEGKGELQPIASNKTREGRAQNRRVEIEIVGSRKN
ncbi:outer membrane protein A [Bordetella pertussis]|uniref:Outer membrane protein A n=3 Tax=Bordetella pertussis TaxID=520 RepID=Q7VZG6_BORPE|nr:OmpA family protein [Bordetella pertussis]ETH84881.1 outer membrane protein A [Bordetella pertussis STO1-CHOC-0017]ETH87920.1 outer membrane protein A [Bordetella pertussis STO1-CHOC-0018]KCV20643.1 outer membrane protein A [Bordetella pertussis B200]AEE66363.1 outer membrane protein A precursor [Bordetella pertussis CS]AIW93167.1 outer membrane protein A [Bordetella pertussis B1917]